MKKTKKSTDHDLISRKEAIRQINKYFHPKPVRSLMGFIKEIPAMQEYTNQATGQRESGESVEDYVNIEIGRYKEVMAGDLHEREEKRLRLIISDAFIAGWQSKQGVSNWISVEVEKPKYYHPVMCYHKNTPCIEIAWLATNGEYDLFTVINSDRVLTTVTHWQPLPTPPSK